MIDLSGSVLRSYHVRRKVAEGGQGAIYYALQALGSTSREVALKVIQPQFATIPGFIRRFEAEAQIVAGLEHPYIVPLYDYWSDAAGAYLVMRWMQGGSLEETLRHEPLQIETVMGIIEQVAAALAYAHARGVVHRDLKPANLLRDRGGNTYLADFGIAIGGELVAGTPLSEARAFTPGYAAPEQILLAPATPQSDLYSLGVVLYELLTGRPAFPGQTAEERVRKQLEGQLPSIQSFRPELPATLDAVMQRATARDHQARYADAHQFVDALHQALRSTYTPRYKAKQQSTSKPESPGSRTRAFRRRLFGVITIGILLLSTLAILNSLKIFPGRNTLSGACAEGSILFASDRDGDYEVYVMNPDGSGQRQLTDNNDQDILPRWSPDRDRIVFASNRDGQGNGYDLYIMDSNGQTVSRMTWNTAEDPAWSPDGKYIAFSSVQDGNWEIYRIDIAGTNQKRLTANTVWDTRPWWAPTGDKIVYSSRASRSNDIGPWDLRTVNADGTNDIVIVSNGGRNFRSVWSPDGRHIAYVTDLHGHDNWEIYVVNADGTEPRRLTNDAAPDVEVAWSPDSRCLAFVREEAGGNREIYTMTVEGKNLKKLTNNPAKDWYISWVN